MTTAACATCGARWSTDEVVCQECGAMLEEVSPAPVSMTPVSMTPASAAPRLDLSGTWVCDDYECPPGRRRTELVGIVHQHDRIVATKITGDACVPAGFETFSGRLPVGTDTGAVTWTTGWPEAPASVTSPGFLRLVGPDRFVAGYPGYPELTFRRVDETAGHPTRPEPPGRVRRRWR